MDKRATGLYAKFRVERTDGTSEPGAKHDGCEVPEGEPHDGDPLVCIPCEAEEDARPEWQRLPGVAQSAASVVASSASVIRAGQEQIRALIEQWRTEADNVDGDGDFCCALTIRGIADELEAFLSSQTERGR